MLLKKGTETCRNKIPPTNKLMGSKKQDYIPGIFFGISLGISLGITFLTSGAEILAEAAEDAQSDPFLFAASILAF